MKRKNYLAFTAFLSLVFLAFSGCKKDGKNPVADCDFCRVESVDAIFHSGDIEHFDYTYNTKGNPLKTTITLSNPNPDNVFNYTDFFSYDKQDRLIEFVRAYLPYEGHENIFQRHRYSYPAKQTVVDSVYSEGGAIYIRIDKLDSEGRIVQQNEGPYVTKYVYNAQGNLEGDTYDDKPNINRTNKVFQFINKDYSINNPKTRLGATIVAYNQFGLPFSYKALPPNYDPNVLGYFSDSLINITYSCGDHKTSGSKF